MRALFALSFLLSCWPCGANLEASTTQRRTNHLHQSAQQQLGRTYDRTTAKVGTETDLPTAAPVIIDYWPTDPVPTSTTTTINEFQKVPTTSPTTASSLPPTMFSVTVDVVATTSPTLETTTITSLTTPTVEVNVDSTQNGTTKQATATSETFDTERTVSSFTSTSGDNHQIVKFQLIVTLAVTMGSYLLERTHFM